MPGAITRLAPTPSGYLHIGNAVNFLIVSALAEERGAVVALRIDDMDAPRYRREYVDDIFSVLDWLGVSWVVGPRDPVDFEAAHSLRDRTEYYREQLDVARAAGLPAFACRCSRSQSRTTGGTRCVGACREAGFTLTPGESALRAVTPYEDVVLWRRDDLPAYHLASILEDRDLGTTLVVRGEDLAEATAVQRFLAPWFDADALAGATFVHHPLVRGADGEKLSKSTFARGPMARDDGLLEQIQDLARAATPP